MIRPSTSSRRAAGYRRLRRAFFVINSLLLTLTAPLTLAATGHPTIVSLTFDDGLMQSAAIAPLLDTGLKATFYINSNAIRPSGSPDNNDFLTKQELDTLFYRGYDIGGHTIDHVDLATLSETAQRRAICDDLKTLRQWYGEAVYSFAYPFASTGPATRDIVAGGCPGTYGPLHRPLGKYESARSVGASGDCSTCPPAEALPPSDPYFLYSNDSVIATDSLATLQRHVTTAEAHGGWVTLVFHKVCDDCDLYSVKQDTLVRFLFWLKGRAARGTAVRTIHQVMVGDYPGAAPTAAPSARP
ncbi:polysaccharide deacetylase family protein [uncultured Thiodictyon sp.]|nr:polysaccharide deacetylase family protein [uncultured Thiodictyon sp.]